MAAIPLQPSLFPFVEFKGQGFENASNKEIIVFLAGFPDDATSGWQPLVDRLLQYVNNEGKNHHFICLCLPGFEKGGKQRRSKWGYSFFELTQMMHATLEHLIPGDQARYTLILHDWGCFVGFLYQNYYPSKISKIVALDVGHLEMEESPIHHTLILMGYQWMFASSFVVSRLFGNFLGQCVFMFWLLVMSKLPFISPCPNDKPPRLLSEISVSMCYPYFQIWKDIFTNQLLKPKYPEGVPLLFMFGTKKNCLFHSPSFLKKIEESPNSKWLSYDVGHWLHLYEADSVAQQVQKFLTVGAAPAAVGAHQR